MNLWESRLYSPDVPFAKYVYDANYTTRHFHLIAQPIKHHILDNVVIDSLGYSGSTPGPVIVIKQGEWISLTVENRLDEDTALHVHGLSKSNSQDGVPEIEPNTPKIKPGESFTYHFLAWQAGTFFYHSSMGHQIALGLLGAFIVLPSEEEVNFIPDKDYIMVLQQWELPQEELGKVTTGVFKPNQFDRHPNFFTINGKAFPNTTPIYTQFNDVIRIRFINKSSASHAMHVHGHDFNIVSVDGFERNEWDDTVDVSSGKRIEIQFKTQNPGIWPINGTKTFHQSNNGETPGGMTTKLIYQ